MPYNTLFCRICICTSHATLECNAKIKFRSPNLKVISNFQAQIVEVDVDIDDCLRDRYCYNAYYKNGDSYEDVFEAFIEEAISATTPK